MAEQLGSAVLTVSVDDTQLRAGLQAAQTNARSAGQAIEQAFTKSGKQLQTAANGLQYYVDAQGRARDAAGKFLALAERQAAGITRVGEAAAGAGRGLGGLTLGGAGAATSVLAVAVAIAGVGSAAVKSAGEIQRLNAAFIGLTGSAEAAKQLRQDLFTLSKTTPFKNEEILLASQRFLAVGVNAKNLQGTLNRVGALAAQSGQPLERLALIYAQVYAKGRLQGEENMQLLEAGVDLTQELGAVTGLSGKALQDAMSNGKISVADFNKALVLASGDMKSLQLAGQAVDVQFNNIFDNFGQLFGGFAQAIAPALSAAFKVVNDIFDQAFPSLDSITQFFQPLADGAKAFANALAGNPALLATIAGWLKDIGGIYIQAIGDSLKYVARLLSSIDGKALVNGLIIAELQVKRVALGMQALGAYAIKFGELLGRAITNPIQFGKDVIKAGGIDKFIQEQYKYAQDVWNRAVNAKPLVFPTVKPTNEKDMKGELDNKQAGPDLAVLAAQQQQKVEARLALDSVQRRIAAAKELAKAESGVVRQQVQQRQEIKESIRTARDRVTSIGAQIDALRLQGKDNDPQLQKLVDEQKVAAEEVRLKLIEGATALKDAGKQLRDDLKAATLDLAGARNDPQGLNQYLNQQQINERGQATLKMLLPQFREAQGRFTQLTGAAAPEFLGSTSGVIESVRQFIGKVDREFNGTKNVNDIQTALNANTKDLVTINSQLATQVSRLADKNWSVNVNVQPPQAFIPAGA